MPDLDMLIQLGAVLIMALIALYVLSLSVGWMRQSRAQNRLAGAQAALFEAETGRLMDQRKIEREEAELSWSGWRKFEIARKSLEAKDICSFYLKPHDRRPLPPFKPGQFLTFRLNIPGESKPVIRCYSLSDAPGHADRYRNTIKRVPPPRDNPAAPPGQSSSYFHDILREGDIVDVKAPSGKFYLDMEKQSPVVLVGGGIGLTPVLSMLNAIADSGSKRETWFFYGLISREDHVMKEHLQALDQTHENIHVVACYSNPTDTCREGEDYTRQGWVSVDLFKEMLPSNNYDFYVCGPPPMMDAIVGGLADWGVPEARIHFEAFGPATVKKVAEGDDGTSFEVVFAKSGKAVTWTTAAGSLLDLAEREGIVIESGCRAGNCGTCVTAVKEGDVDYMNDPGEMPDAGSCLTCIGKPKGRVVLDI